MYKYTHVYIYENMFFLYIKYLKYICVCIYIINMHSTQTDIM